MTIFYLNNYRLTFNTLLVAQSREYILFNYYFKNNSLDIIILFIKSSNIKLLRSIY